jgi:hypothetical protein
MITFGKGVGFYDLLALLFIGLKLTDYIDWPWLWVLSPIWLPLLIVVVMWIWAVARLKNSA